MPRKFNVHKWDKSDYNYYTLTRERTFKDLKKEYARLRKEAERRLGALSRSKNETAQDLYNKYSDILLVKAPRTKKLTAKQITALETFLSLKTSKVTEIYAAQRKALSTLQEHGYDFITKNNLKKFGRFMEAMRSAGYARKGASSSVMEFLSEKREIGSNVEEMKKKFLEWEATQT